jgi:hypothetical protein
MKMKRIVLIVCLWLIPLYAGGDPIADWTWIYRKNFTKNLHVREMNKKALFFSHDNVSPFTQLIFSWNAFRPEQGHFSFFVQVRNAATKKWGAWHRMVDWGKDVQQSYLSKSDGFSSYVHVRLETDDKKAADAFKIKIEPHNAAPLSLVRGVCVALSDFNMFKAEVSQDITDSLQSVHLSRIPLIAQFALEHEDNGRICSPVSCSMVVHYLTGTYKDPLAFAAGAFDTGLGVYGSWGCNMAHAFEHAGGKTHFFVRRMNSFADLHHQLVQGVPVVVSVRGNLPGALKPFPHGHLIVVVGWDGQTREVLCHDPASESHDTVFKRYPLEHFLRAWECSHRLAYIAEPVIIGEVKNAQK